MVVGAMVATAVTIKQHLRMVAQGPELQVVGGETKAKLQHLILVTLEVMAKLVATVLNKVEELHLQHIRQV